MNTVIETITIKKTDKGVWMKRFDNYEKSFHRTSKADALGSIEIARSKNRMISDDGEESSGVQYWCYEN